MKANFIKVYHLQPNHWSTSFHKANSQRKPYLKRLAEGGLKIYIIDKVKAVLWNETTSSKTCTVTKNSVNPKINIDKKFCYSNKVTTLSWIQSNSHITLISFKLVKSLSSILAMDMWNSYVIWFLQPRKQKSSVKLLLNNLK